MWDCHENRRDGSDFRDARTGEVIFQIPSKADVGRAVAADTDPTNPSVEMWSSDSHVIRHLYEREAPAVNMFTKESPDELNPKLNN